MKNRYPLPRADQLFDKLAHAKYFSKIDLRTGFYQILISEKDRHKTAFTTSRGLFEYNVLPMGLCNSPGVFMALMNDTFRDYLDKFVLVFLDDIIVYSDTHRGPRAPPAPWRCSRLRKQRLYAKASKSALCQTEVEFLGHYVGRNGLRVMEDKIEAVRDWPVPTTMKELRAFLGLAGYYRRFVKELQQHRAAAHRTHAERHASATAVGHTTAAGVRRAQASAAVHAGAGAAGSQSALRGSLRRLRLRRWRRAAAGPRHRPAADRVPVEED